MPEWKASVLFNLYLAMLSPQDLLGTGCGLGAGKGVVLLCVAAVFSDHICKPEIIFYFSLRDIYIFFSVEYLDFFLVWNQAE